jgi:hypothetical protein
VISSTLAARAGGLVAVLVASRLIAGHASTQAAVDNVLGAPTRIALTPDL